MYIPYYTFLAVMEVLHVTRRPYLNAITQRHGEVESTVSRYHPWVRSVFATYRLVRHCDWAFCS